MHLQENIFFDLDLEATRNVALYSLHQVIYASAKFKVTTSNGLGKLTITRNVTDGQTYGRRTDDGSKLMYTIFLTKKRV